MNTRNIAVVLGLILVALDLRAENTNTWKITYESSWRSSYIAFRSSRQVVDDPVIWNGVTVDWKNGLWLYTWDSFNTKSKPENKFGNEIDLTTGRKWRSHGLTWNTGLGLLNLAPIEEVWEDDVGVLIASVGTREYRITPNHSLQGVLYNEWLWETDDFSDGDIFFHPSIKHTWTKVCGWNLLSFSEGHTLDWDSGWRKNEKEGVNYRIDTALSWTINEQLVIILPALRYVTPLIDASDGRESASQWWGGFKTSF